MKVKPALFTCLSPALLKLYDINQSIVVIIDVLRATSTIATALHNGAKAIVPVDSVAECLRLGRQIDAVTAGERDGQIAEGLAHGNSPFEYPASFIKNKTLVLTTTNGTRLLHMSLERGAQQIITGSFPNLQMVCDYLLAQEKPVLLACAAWKNKVNIEDALFAGAVIDKVQGQFDINCDASQIAKSLHKAASGDYFSFLQSQGASHYLRLMGFGLEKDIRYCLETDNSPVLPIYKEGKLIAAPTKK